MSGEYPMIETIPIAVPDNAIGISPSFRIEKYKPLIAYVPTATIINEIINSEFTDELIIPLANRMDPMSIIMKP